MTEQGKGEKEMDEIAIHLMVVGYFRDRAEMIAQDILPYVIGRIIEKEKETRKETAREIVNCLIDGWYISVARNIAEKYGVEVEE